MKLTAEQIKEIKDQNYTELGNKLIENFIKNLKS